MRNKVLLIDDNPVILALATAALQASGFDVVSSVIPFGFAALLAEHRPDVVLVDVLMPALKGDQLVEITNRNRERDGRPRELGAPRLILFSSLPGAELAELARNCGADGFIAKSRCPRHLGEDVRAMLPTRTSLRPAPRPGSSERPNR